MAALSAQCIRAAIAALHCASMQFASKRDSGFVKVK